MKQMNKSDIMTRVSFSLTYISSSISLAAKIST